MGEYIGEIENREFGDLNVIDIENVPKPDYLEEFEESLEQEEYREYSEESILDIDLDNPSLVKNRSNPFPVEDWSNPLPDEFMLPDKERDEFLTRERVEWSKIFQPRILDENNLTEEEINSLKEWFDRDIYAYLERSQMNEEGKLELVEQVEILKERYKKLVREQTGEMIR